MTNHNLLRAACFAAIACLPFSCTAPSPSSPVTIGSAATELYPVKDLVVATNDTPATLPMGDLVQAVAQASGLSQLPSDSYAIDAEAGGMLRVTASADMQKKVRIVLTDMRRWSASKQKI